jgi:hypothetical protein
MNPDAFRKLALSLPESLESAHLDHPDFRVGKRIFATLGYPTVAWAMVKLTPSQQRRYVGALPTVFVAVKGGWGLRGATNIKLRTATRAAVWPALVDAWRNTAPAALLKRQAALDG